jgi:hypothetical protein
MPAIPILLMSGHAAGALPGEAVLPSGTSLIRKPFTMSALLRSLHTILGENS